MELTNIEKNLLYDYYDGCALKSNFWKSVSEDSKDDAKKNLISFGFLVEVNSRLVLTEKAKDFMQTKSFEEGFRYHREYKSSF